MTTVTAFITASPDNSSQAHESMYDRCFAAVAKQTHKR